jgi:hypothetical protein
VERLAQEIHKGKSPSDQMFLELGARLMDTSDFVQLLDQLHLEDVLENFVQHGEETNLSYGRGNKGAV